MSQPDGWSEFMTKEEIRELTGKRGQALQVAVLIEERIPHKVLRGRLLVSRFHVREWLEGRTPARVGVGINLAAAARPLPAKPSR
ncbi:MAG: DUF4224 domain-containing protein [Burkholderiales bacterium]|jgi:hypothetical protein|nr:DUF4224 domain-containing protein [Burkholderiales bacterium]